MHPHARTHACPRHREFTRSQHQLRTHKKSRTTSLKFTRSRYARTPFTLLTLLTLYALWAHDMTSLRHERETIPIAHNEREKVREWAHSVIDASEAGDTNARVWVNTALICLRLIYEIDTRDNREVIRDFKKPRKEPLIAPGEVPPPAPSDAPDEFGRVKHYRENVLYYLRTVPRLSGVIIADVADLPLTGDPLRYGDIKR